MNRRAPRLPPLNALRAFEVSARHLNFRLAAAELGVTQSAVAQQVRGLEADLGVRLFERLPRTLALTGEGRAYAARLRRAFELLAEATAALRPETRQATISATPTFAARWLIPRLPELAVAHPDLELRIIAGERLADFGADGVDVAVRQGRPPFGPGLAADLLFEGEVVAVGSPALLRGREQRLATGGLADFTLLHDAHDLWPDFIERALGGDRSRATRGPRFSQTSLALDAATAGQGLALASRFLVERDLAARRLVLACDAALRAASDFYVVAPRRQKPGPACSVRDWLLEQRLK